MKEIFCNARRQYRRPEYNPQSDDVYRQAHRPTPQRHMPRPPSRATDDTTRPLRVGVIGANLSTDSQLGQRHPDAHLAESHHDKGLYRIGMFDRSRLLRNGRLKLV